MPLPSVYMFITKEEVNMENCIFCKIAAGEIPSNRAFESESLFAFHDISPQAPSHVLIIPKKHIGSMQELGEADSQLMGEAVITAAKIADQLGLGNGYRLVCNTGADGGQTVGHIHFHLLGGRALEWPPG